MKKNLILTGMMGVGKSTIGKIIAKKLNHQFVDIDNLIEIKEKSTIKHIFKNKGEEYFRRIEKKITTQELKKNNLVIALGGGGFIDDLIRKEIKSSCVSFWLDLNLSTLIMRLKNNRNRPLLDKDNLEYSINKIYSQRKKIYNESDYKIKCNSMTKNQIVGKIVKLYEASRN